MSDGKDALDLSALGAAIPNAAELSAEEKANLVESIKNTLQGLAARHTDMLESLEPNVRKRVEVLTEIQDKFFEERAALEAKYQKMYEPLYSKALEDDHMLSMDSRSRSHLKMATCSTLDSCSVDVT